MSIKQVIIENLEKLPLEKQQEVLDFINVLQSNVTPPKTNKEKKESVSFLVAAQEFAGCVDGGPGDLATNKKGSPGIVVTHPAFGEWGVGSGEWGNA